MRFLTVVAVMAVLFILTGYQITSETAATRLLGRLAGALIQVDLWVPAHEEDIKLLARDKPQSTVNFTDLPLALSLPASQVIDADPASLRALIVQTSGRALYRDGIDVFRDSEGRGGRLGVDEPARWTIAFLGDGAHGFWRALLPLSLLALLGVCAAVLLSGRQPLGLIATGAAASAVASLGAWLLTAATSNAFSSAVDREIVLIVRDGAWIGLRNSVAVAAASLALLLLMRWLSSQQQTADDWEPNQAATSQPPDAPPL
jgi:hypothetical protein